MDNRTVYMDVEAQKDSKYDKIKKRKFKSPATLEWASGKTTIGLAFLFCMAIMLVYVWQSHTTQTSTQNTTNPFLKWLSQQDGHSNHKLFPSHALFTPSDHFHIMFLVRQQSLVNPTALERALTSIADATNAHTAHITAVQVGSQSEEVQRIINKHKASLFEHHLVLDENISSVDLYKEALQTGFAQLKQTLPRLSYTELPSLGKDPRDREVQLAVTNGNRKLTENDYVKYVIVMQDNEVVSKDFFVLFQQVAPIFAADESLFSVTAYNKLSKEGNELALHRMNHFSDNTWMISRRIHNLLMENWSSVTDNTQFTALAEKVMTDKNMATMYPEVSRAKEFKESGIKTSDLEFVDLFGKGEITWSIVGLTKANYEWEIIQNDWIIPGELMLDLNSLPGLIGDLKKNSAVLIYHDSPTHQDFYAKWLQLVKKMAKREELDKIPSDVIQSYVYDGLFQHTTQGVKYVWIEKGSPFSNLLLKHKPKATLLTPQNFNL